MDASTLGKIDVRGPDAPWFLDQLYVNVISTIPVGRARYSVMCHVDGTILDDGVVMRIAEQQFFVTTSTGHAAAVVDWMEEWLQTEWPAKRVWVTPITEQLATIAIIGPRSREVIAAVAPDVDVSRTEFPFHSVVRNVTAAGIAGSQIARVSFSGELAFEVSVPWHEAPTLWDALLVAGSPHDITPYGLDALQALRIEKGFIIVGQDTEALTTPFDVGLGGLVSQLKDCVGAARGNARQSPRRPRAARRLHRRRLARGGARRGRAHARRSALPPCRSTATSPAAAGARPSTARWGWRWCVVDGGESARCCTPRCSTAVPCACSWWSRYTTIRRASAAMAEYPHFPPALVRQLAGVDRRGVRLVLLAAMSVLSAARP
jgi:glycine cleavage system aminomethyltransferase T